MRRKFWFIATLLVVLENGVVYAFVKHLVYESMTAVELANVADNRLPGTETVVQGLLVR